MLSKANLAVIWRWVKLKEIFLIKLVEWKTIQLNNFGKKTMEALTQTRFFVFMRGVENGKK